MSEDLAVYEAIVGSSVFMEEAQHTYRETIPERGQSACLLKKEHLAVLSAPGETFQASIWTDAQKRGRVEKG